MTNAQKCFIIQLIAVICGAIGGCMRVSLSRKKLVRSFEKYIRLGLDDERLDVFEVCRRIERTSSTKAYAKDIFAVWETCRLLRLEGRASELATFKRVYIGALRNGETDISASVMRCALDTYYDQRTVYRHLAYVEKKYALIRKGL